MLSFLKNTNNKLFNIKKKEIIMNKICYFNLATYSQTGGIENYNKTFINALDRLNEEITSVSVYDSSNNCNYRNIEFRNYSKKKIKSSFYIFSNIWKVNKLFIAHINLLPVAIICKILNPKLKIFVTIYGIEVWKKLPYLYRWFLKNAKILSISNYTTDTFLNHNALTGNNIYYLPPETEVGEKNDFMNVYDPNDFNILSVTRLNSSDSYKGIDSMIKSIPYLLKYIKNVKYTIIGKGNDKERLQQLAIKLGISSNIDFKGFVQDIEPYYQFCDIFSLPSKGEGFGIVYLEAMKYKKPCIACDIGGQTDVVLDNATGFLCSYDSIEFIAEKINEIFYNQDLREEFGKAGYEHFLENFTFEKFKNRLRKIIND